MKLTNQIIKQWIKDGVTDVVKDDEVPGLQFRRSRIKGKASVRFYYRNSKKQQKIKTLGSFPNITIQIARKMASEFFYKEQLQLNTDVKVYHSYTFEEYLKKHYSIVLAKKKSGKEIEQRIKKHFRFLMKTEIKDAKCSDIREWQKEKENKGLRFSTLKKVYGSFKAMINFGVKEGEIETNPLKNCYLLKDAFKKEGLTTETKRILLTDEQSKRFLLALECYEDLKWKGKRPERKDVYFDRIKPSMILLYYQGMRIGDVITLDWTEFNRENGTLRFTPNKLEHKNPMPQVFKLATVSYQVLMNWWVQNGCPKSGPVFPNKKTGKPYTKTSFKKVWPLIKEMGGLPEDLHLQTLRHNFASQKIKNRVDVFTVAKMMATSVKMIEEYYGHLRPENAISDMDDMIGLPENNE